MPRYLNPAKICLLSLIEVYISDEVAEGARLAVLSFLHESIYPFHEHHDAYLDQRFRLSTSTICTFSEALAHLPSEVPERSVHDVLMERIWLWDELESFDGLFERLCESIAAPLTARPSRASPLGQYIRRCLVEFTRLQFGDVTALWRDFVAYRNPSRGTWTPRDPELAPRRRRDEPEWVNAINADVDEDASFISGFSRDDNELLLGFSVRRLQRWGTRIPRTVQSKLEQWISDTSETSAQSLKHFLGFFDHWRAGQCDMAQESLQKYFDYSLTKQPGTDMKVYYQYALLHKSVLFADFERWDDSIDAMSECIATARENQDIGCLNLALSWLIHLRQAYPRSPDVSFKKLAILLGGGNGEEDEIAFLKAKAQEVSHWSLLSSTLLEEAKVEAHKNGNSPKVFESILQASHVNMVHNLRGMMAATAMIQGSIWERLGQIHLFRVCYDSVRSLHIAHSPLSDLARSSCRIVHTLARSGKYQEAFTALDETEHEVQGVLKLKQRYQAFRGMIWLQRHVRHADGHAADHVLHLLRPMISSADLELEFEIELLSIDYLDMMLEPSPRASRIAHMIARLQNNKNHGDIAREAHLIILSQLHGYSGKSNIFGLTQFLRGAGIALRHMLVPTLVEALTAIAGGLHTSLGHKEAATDILEAILPTGHESGHVRMVAAMYCALGQIKVHTAGQTAVTDPARTWNLQSASEYFRRAREIYFDLEDLPHQLSTLYREHVIHRFAGDVESATRMEQAIRLLVSESRDRGDRALSLFSGA